MSVTQSPDMATDGPDDLAGAYVLGVLDPVAWSQARARVNADPDFAAEVVAWEARLTPLVELLDSQLPSRDLWPDILRALPANDVGGANIRIWRGLTAAFGLIAAASLVAVIVIGSSGPIRILAPAPGQPQSAAVAPPEPEPLQVALLRPEKGQAFFVATLDRQRRQMTVSPGAAPSPKGKSLELWMIAPGAKPQALGVIPSDASASMPMPDAFAGKGATPIILAVSVEPIGGSPTGQPTGPVVATGAFKTV